MSQTPHSYSSRAVGFLIACGMLIVFAGLAGLGATAISVIAASDEEESAQPDSQPVAGQNQYRFSNTPGRIGLLPRFGWTDTAQSEGRGFFTRLPRHPAHGRAAAAPLARYDADSR